MYDNYLLKQYCGFLLTCMLANCQNEKTNNDACDAMPKLT